jgi:hypothetical protein
MFYFATLIFIILSANGTFLPFSNINWFIVEFIFIWIGIEYDRFSKADIRLFVKFGAIYIAYCTARLVFFTHLPMNYYISDIIYLFKYILPSFLYCALLKDKALYYISRVITDLAIISIPFFLIQVAAGDMLYSIGNAINLPPHVEGYEFTNFVVFVFSRPHEFQNSGFAWEPGAYGFFLNIGLMLHFMHNRFAFDKRAMWLVIAIITTLSTTSFIALMLIILLFFRAREMKMSLLLTIAGPVLFVAIFQLPFLADKIIGTYQRDLFSLKNIEFLSRYYIQNDQTFALNRFASMIYIYDLFGAQMILGVSNIYNETQPVLKNISISNGVFEFCAKFGVVGMGVLLYNAYRYFRVLTFNFEQAFYGVILILILGFGESIFVLPLTTAFYFLCYYALPHELEEEEESSVDELQLGHLA